MQRRLSRFFSKSRGESMANDPQVDFAELPPGWVEKYTLDDIPYFYNETTFHVSLTNPSTRGQAEDKVEWTWVPDPKDLWVPAEITSREKDGSTACTTEGGRKVLVPKSGKMKSAGDTNGRDQVVPLWPLKQNDLMHCEDDLIMLERVNDGSINYNLSQSYRKGMLYTWVGATHRVLVSINPYERLPLYGEEQIKEHHDKSPNKEVAPHIFDIAEEAYNAMLIDGKHQSILISGESGAGKTEATKQCLKFWARIAGSKNHVEDKLIQANPVLEAFGNAKTIRNNNSSRFGKWMEVYFSLADRSIEGAVITNFLLEKSRLSHQQAGERNFHIFYQLLQSAEMRKKYELGTVTENRYTQKGLTSPIPGMDDGADFVETQKAMKDLEFTPDECDFLLRVPAALLHLGNVTFEAEKVGHSDGSKVLGGSVPLAAKYLKVDEVAMGKALVSRTITVRGEVSVIPLDHEAALRGADSLTKGIYSRLFDWLVKRCNTALASEHVESSKQIGVLDIFGFEIFEENSFEQLCINYCNEKLQQLFNIETFQEEEELYTSEGITFAHITFIDSAPVLSMIEEGPKGILPVLDDECKLEGDDKKFLAKITNNFQANRAFQIDKKRNMENKLSFEIVHYAGVVQYTTEEFKEKNSDTFFQDAYDLGASSADPVLASIFPALTEKVKVVTLSFTFRAQLNELMTKLRTTSTRYVRCVKPNEEMKPLVYDAPLVMRQLRYSGVFEAVAIRKQGYPFRFKYSVFSNRYRLCNPDHAYKSTAESKAGVEEVFKTNVNLAEFLTSGDVALGKTMILYRAPVYKLLKLLRNLGLETIVPRAKLVLRGVLARKMLLFCTRLEAELKKAFDTLTDINAMRAAVANVEVTLKTLPRLFPKVGPRNLWATEDRILGLEKVEVEELKVEKLMAESDPNSEYKVWCAQMVELDSVAHIPKHPPQKAKFDAFLKKLAESDPAKKLTAIQAEYFGILGPELFGKVIGKYQQ